MSFPGFPAVFLYHRADLDIFDPGACSLAGIQRPGGTEVTGGTLSIHPQIERLTCGLSTGLRTGKVTMEGLTTPPAKRRPEPMPGFLRVAPSMDANTELPMPDLHSINLHLQERLEREWRGEVSAVEAAGWLDEAGLLRDRKNGLPLRNLLRAGRIAGQEQRPNQPNGRWWIRRLVASPDPHQRARARERIVKYLPIDRDILPADWPLRRGEPAFWEELGKTVAAFGYLENALTLACYTLSATPEKAASARADGDEAVSKWFAGLERSWTDSMNALTREIDRTLKEDSRVPTASAKTSSSG